MKNINIFFLGLDKMSESREQNKTNPKGPSMGILVVWTVKRKLIKCSIIWAILADTKIWITLKTCIYFVTLRGQFVPLLLRQGPWLKNKLMLFERA